MLSLVAANSEDAVSGALQEAVDAGIKTCLC